MKTCIRCLNPKPLDQFSKNTYRCHSCRAEANKLNVQEHRAYTAEVAANKAFSDMYRDWKVA